MLLSLKSTSTNEKVNVDLLADAVKIAIGYRTIDQFARACNMVDSWAIEKIINKKIAYFPPREILRSIARASQGRVTHTYLYELCGYSEQDPEEDRTWATYYPKRGDIYNIDLGYFNEDAEQNGIRPCVVVQNNLGNERSSTIVVCPLTSKVKKPMSTHVKLTRADGMMLDSVIMVEQTRCVSKRRMFYNGFPMKIATLSETKVRELNVAIEIEFGLTDVLFDESKAFELIYHIKLLQNNIQVKKSFDLDAVLEGKFKELQNYCFKYKRDAQMVINEFERLTSIGYAM